jgi:hypothetical protein
MEDLAKSLSNAHHNLWIYQEVLDTHALGVYYKIPKITPQEDYIHLVNTDGEVLHLTFLQRLASTTPADLCSCHANKLSSDKVRWFLQPELVSGAEHELLADGSQLSEGRDDRCHISLCESNAQWHTDYGCLHPWNGKSLGY